MGNYYGDIFGCGSGGGLMMILFWVGIVFFIVWLVREVIGKKDYKETRGPESTLDILKERYAKGEIDKKEFEEKKKDLS